jgi:hypothetical protein
MGVAIALFVVSGIANVWIGFSAEAGRTGRFGRYLLRPRGVGYVIATGIAVGLSVVGVDRLTDGRSTWSELGWIAVAGVASGLLQIIPMWITRHRQGRTLRRGDVRVAAAQE